MIRMQLDTLARTGLAVVGIVVTTLAFGTRPASADEGGVSFWLPGIFGSLAAVPQQPGFSLTSMYYHTSVSADGAVARAREITSGRLSAVVSANVQASLGADADIALVIPSYTFASPVFGGQATIGLMTVSGRSSASVDALLNASVLVGPSRSRARDSTASATRWPASAASFLSSRCDETWA